MGFSTHWLEWIARTLALPSSDRLVWLLNLIVLFARLSSTGFVGEPVGKLRGIVAR